MSKTIISLMFVLVFVMGSCGGDGGKKDDTGDSGNTGNTGNTCTGSDKFCHSHDGLDWSDGSSSSMNWNDAITYCEILGGKLPTISELRTLIQNCPVTETGSECGVTDKCLSYADCRNDPCGGCEYDNSGRYSVFGDNYWLWSSSEQSDDTDYAWNVDFLYGIVNDSYRYSNFFVRCVR